MSATEPPETPQTGAFRKVEIMNFIFLLELRGLLSRALRTSSRRLGSPATDGGVGGAEEGADPQTPGQDRLSSGTPHPAETHERLGSR